MEITTDLYLGDSKSELKKLMSYIVIIAHSVTAVFHTDARKGKYRRRWISISSIGGYIQYVIMTLRGEGE